MRTFHPGEGFHLAFCSRSLACSGAGLGGASPHTRSHTHWLAGVAEGFVKFSRGCFRSWLSSWRSRFSSHMSTEALWEAF